MTMKRIDREAHYDEMVNLWGLEQKILYSKKKIEEFIKDMESKGHKELVVAFSGGKDSTALLDLVYKVHKEIKSKTQLVIGYATEITFKETMEYIRKIEQLYKLPLEIKAPKMAWKTILTEKGYPVKGKRFSVMINRLIQARTKNYLTYDAFGLHNAAKYGPRDKKEDVKKSVYYILRKHDLFYLDKDMVDYVISEKCCDLVKGGLKKDKRPTFIGTMAEESYLRKTKWLQNGCNVFTGDKFMSKPLSIWTEANVWEYESQTLIKKYNPMYEYYSRLGCVSCTFGTHLEEKKKVSKTNIKVENRFDTLLRIRPDLYKSQVWDTGIYRVLADMNITIKNDVKYMEYFKGRRKQIDEWNSNLEENLIKVMHRIQDNKNWTYSYEEICEAYSHFKLKKPTRKLFNKYDW